MPAEGPPPFHVAIRDAATGLPAAQQALAGFLGAAGVAPRPAARAAVLAEEVALNALRHGGAREVRLEAWPALPGCRLVFTDDGSPFDPAAVALPPPATSLATAPAGGRGLVLLHRLAASLAHSRAGGRNRLEVVIAGV